MSAQPADRRLRALTQQLAVHPTAAGPTVVAAVTGCTSGLGLNLCKEFMRRGMKVAGCGRRKDLVDALNKEHGGSGSAFYVVDTSNVDSVKAWAASVLADFGRVDILCNNAGMGGAGKLPWKMDDAHFGQVIDTNVKGVFYVQKYFIQSMLDDLVSHPDRGVTKRVINTSSGVGHSTSPVLAEYSTSKWGVEALSKSTAQGFNVLRDSPKTSDAMKKACGQILCVPLAPGVIGTEMNRTKGLPTAADWCSTAVDFILSIPVSESGSSLSVPGFYGAEYRSTWVIPDGMRLPTKWVNPS